MQQLHQLSPEAGRVKRKIRRARRALWHLREERRVGGLDEGCAAALISDRAGFGVGIG